MTGAFDRRLITPMVLGSILNPVNSSMLAVALVPIGRAFGAPPSQTAWLVTGLYLATAVGQPVIGRLVDIHGPRRLYLAGTALVGVAGLLGALAPDLTVLVASRVLLGLGTSAAYPASMYLIRAEAERTGQASPAGVLSVLSAANQVVSVLGPTLGGLLIGLGGWHMIFTVNVPLSLACLVIGAMRLPRLSTKDSGAGVDSPGVALFAGALVVFMLFVMRPGVDRWYLPVAAAVVGTLFAVRELRVATPFIDLRVLAGNVPLLATYARQLLAYISSYAFLYGFTQWLEEGRGLSPSLAGLLLLPMSGVAIAVTIITGRRPQVRGKLIVGGTLQLVAAGALLALDGDTAVGLILAVTVVVGLPQGLNGLANQNALYHQADPDRMGSSAGLLRTFTYLGALVSAAVNAMVFRDGAHTAGLHDLAWFLLVVAALSLLVTLLDRSLARVGRPVGAECP